MNHYNNDHGPDHRYKNDALNEQRKTNALLEQIVQLLNQKKEGVMNGKPNKGTSINNTSKGQPRQRNSNSNGNSRNKSK